MTSQNFHGWACAGKGQPLEWKELELKKFDDDTVEMDITHCGICGSDIHTMDSGWGETDYPCVVGHEIVGVCTRVGKNIKHVRVGDRVGVGAQSLSCGDCDCCLSGDENLCSQGLLGNGGTYNGHYLTGEKTYGGYADRWSGDGRFVFNIPVSMTNEMAATFLCAGVTTYAPLKRYNIGPGDRVGVIGLGGLGHFAVQWIKAMGAEAVVLSHSNRKIEDAIELGCDDYIVSHNVDAMRKNKSTMTHIICTSFANSFDWSLFLNLLKVNGRLILCAIPETPLSGIPPMLLSAKQLRISGTIIGSPRMIEDMLRFAARTHVQPWVNTYSMKDCPASVQAIRDGKPRYRIVLANDN